MAKKAGSIIRSAFGTPRSREFALKNDGTPVTPVDQDVNDFVCDWISRNAPEVSVIGEEKSQRGSGPYSLIIDPVDGTKNLIAGIPIMMFTAALVYEGIPQLCVMYDPILRHVYYTKRGTHGASMDSQGISVCISPGREPVIGVSTWPNCGVDILAMVRILQGAGFQIVSYGSIAYMMMLVARGEFVGTLFPGQERHDTVAGDLLIKEAGGYVTDLLGCHLSYDNGRIIGHISACNPEIHSLIQRVVNKHW